jgi:hypothetical protein
MKISIDVFHELVRQWMSLVGIDRSSYNICHPGTGNNPYHYLCVVAGINKIPINADDSWFYYDVNTATIKLGHWADQLAAQTGYFSTRNILEDFGLGFPDPACMTIGSRYVDVHGNSYELTSNGLELFWHYVPWSSRNYSLVVTSTYSPMISAYSPYSLSVASPPINPHAQMPISLTPWQDTVDLTLEEQKKTTCECGAHKTSNPNCHSTWCPDYNKNK